MLSKGAITLKSVCAWKKDGHDSIIASLYVVQSLVGLSFLRSRAGIVCPWPVVGICGVAGPVMAGALADRFGFAAFSTVLTTMIAGAAMLQFVVLKRLTGKLAESMAKGQSS